MLLARALWPLPFDCYLLRFPPQSEILPHTDKVKDGKHYRLNIVLKTAQSGGDFICNDILFETKRIKLFRPDVTCHQVTKIVSGVRYVLSIGWIRA